MVQTKIVIVDFDERYLLSMEALMVREYRHTADLELISREADLNQYFAEPRTIDILVINEKLYNPSFSRHKVSFLFILTEDVPNAATAGPLYNNMLYKYTDGKTLMANVVGRSGISHATNLRMDATRVVMVYAPGGGAGQTTLAAGICTLLARSYRRALFVGMDGLQAFGCILKGGQRLQPGTEKTLQQKSRHAYEKIKPMIVSELYDILPPFPAPLPSLGLASDHLLALIDVIKGTKNYDCIVVDAGADFTVDTTRLMAYADRVLFLCTQDADSVFKLHCLLDSIDYSDTAKFTVVCNKYCSNAKNGLSPENGRAYPPIAYIPYDPMIHPQNGEYLAGLESMQILGQQLI